MIGENGHPVLEPDRRYFRHHLNRRVHKARRTRTLLRWAGIILSNAVIAGLLIAFGAQTVRSLATSDDLVLRHIEVAGAANTTPEAVAATLRSLEGRNLLQLDLAEAARLVTSDPWVQDASVKRVLPDTLRVTVRERRPALLAVVDGFVVVVDDRGAPMGPAGPGLAYDLPVVTGIDRLDSGTKAGALARAVAAYRRIAAAAPSLATGLSELDVSRPDRLTAIPSGDGPPLLLDPEAVERNLASWLAMRADVARRTGPLEYVDLRWSRRIALKPKDDLFTRKSE